MGFQDFIRNRGPRGGNYKRLKKYGERETQERRKWLKFKTKILGLHLSPRRIKWRRVYPFLLTKKLADTYSAMVKRMEMDGIYPTVVLSSQWGYPIFSQSTLGRKSVFANKGRCSTD
ncbi:hypothetical protein AMTRI_Chr02g263100 [Amborella trichopoda]